MRKIVNITDKLSFEENPKIQIKDKVFEVNADASTVLEIMGDFKDKSEVDAALCAYNKLFSEKDRAEIAKMKLPFKDLQVIIGTAVSLASGGEEGAGEA